MRIAWLAAASVLVGAVAQDVMVGEFGQTVLGCTCKGGKATHGYCGYHFHFGSSEDKPWCRTKHNCGKPGLKGSWAHCDTKAIERRRAEDGQYYNAKEFREFYNKEGKDKWMNAAPYVEKRLARNQKAYSVFEFRDYYVDALGEHGWVEEWGNSKPEARKADDGKWWTWDEYVQFYGAKEAWRRWDDALSRSRTDL
mmetsp:Transcript_82019/g.198860  ORF Transcript_82019/g.198860 Transcript_82019/m.198860 type:complete len:196 (+) Transcript_82019:82-669(+)